MNKRTEDLNSELKSIHTGEESSPECTEDEKSARIRFVASKIKAAIYSMVGDTESYTKQEQ